MRSRLGGKLWEELTEEEHQKYPGDHEAMVSQGSIAKHSEEHLATTDRGIVMLRRCCKSSWTRWLRARTRRACHLTKMQRRCSFRPATSWRPDGGRV
jgi:hypothetical protein